MTLIEAEVGYLHSDDPGEPSTGKPRLSISDNEANILVGLAAGRMVFEIGTGLGVSTRALARYAISVITQDIDPWVAITIAPTLAVLPNVTCIQDRRKYEPLVDLVFIDGDHNTDAVTEDITFARSLHPHLIVLHDAKYPNVARALDDNWLIIDSEHGLAIGQ